ncbi:hypothetical protein MTO96_029035, partial [Rhipicephalus appendiculatus]
EQFQSSTEIRLWLPQIQKEIEVCLQRSRDSAQPTYEVANFQRRASQLQDYYQACESRLRELEGTETSSMSDSVPVTVTHHMSVTAVTEEPKEPDDEASRSSSLLNDVSPTNEHLLDMLVQVECAMKRKILVV